ncbi:MAG: hypothetical protein H7831_04495 [Magnetococcus sp. WYHC-3]
MSCPKPKDGLIVTRRFSQLGLPPGEPNEPRLLSDFFKEPALVVLGEPGMGKTTCFVQSANVEDDARCMTIRAFLRESNLGDLKKKILYLDALDEQRAGRENGNDILDSIIKRLQECSPSKFRLSCRTADWFGNSDRDELINASPSGSITVIRMEPMTMQQVQELVVARNLEGPAFLEQARQSGIEEWITNPQHLQLVLEATSRGQAWPKTRKELFERACVEFVKEDNEIHRRATKTLPPSGDQLILDAGMLCALILCADLEGVALEQADEGDKFPCLNNIPGADLPRLIMVARTKLFRNPAPNRAAYHHRTLAEYLAARFLVRKMAEGLPAERVRCLLTTEGGLVPSDLRGLHAWVATLCYEPYMSLFIGTDPMGLALYGDPASLSSSRKGDLLDGIHKLAQNNPWFRNHHEEDHPLGRLADAALTERFEWLLRDWRNQSSHMLFTLLDIFRYGKILPISEMALREFIADHAIPSHFRAGAATVFTVHCSDSIVGLKDVLLGLDEHAQPDDNQELRAVLLNALYPSCLSPEELQGLLPPPLPSHFGSYSRFLRRGLMEKTPDAQLPKLMNALVHTRRLHGGKHDSSPDWQSLVGRALTRALELHGEQVPVGTLYSWLSLGTNEYGSTLLESVSGDPRATIRSWLDARPGIVKKLFQPLMQTTLPINLENESIIFFGCMQLEWPSVPAWFPEWCLELACEDQWHEISTALFRIGIAQLFRQPIAPPYPIDRAFSFVERYPEFISNLKPLLSSRLSDGYLNSLHRNVDNITRMEAAKQKNITDLSDRIDGIRNGTDLGALVYLAKIYLIKQSDTTNELPPRGRLRKATSEEIAHAAEEGFVQCLTNPSLPTPEQIGQACAINSEYRIGWPVLAAMDLPSNRVADAGNDNMVAYSAAMAFQLAMEYSSKLPAWFTALIRNFPDLAAKALIDLWQPQVQAGKSYIQGLGPLEIENDFSEMAARVAIPLLKGNRNLQSGPLECLLIAALKRGDLQELRKLFDEVMGDCNNQPVGCPRRATGDNEVQGAVSPQWVALAVLLGWIDWRQDETDPAKALADLLGWCDWPQIDITTAKDDRFANKFFKFIFDLIHGRHHVERRPTGKHLPVALIHALVAILGKIYPPRVYGLGVEVVTEEMTYGERIDTLITQLSEGISKDASDALQSLIDNNELSQWVSYLRYALSQQRQVVANKTFKPLELHDVFNAINGGAPASARDLRAMVVEQIRSIAGELRGGNTDGYKVFWNLGSYGRTTDPIPEEDGRDRLLEMLRNRLSLVDIHADPEGHYANDSRADIKVSFKNWNLPIEIKRDNNEQLWIALNDQLINKYVQDPGAGKHGIYLVFWYGEHGKGLKEPPQNSGISSPSTCHDLEVSLQKYIRPEYRDSVCVMVVDVSTRKPAPKSQEKHS